jgi:hypothetical protein
MDRRLHNTTWLPRTTSTSRITTISRMYNNTHRSNKEKGLGRIKLYGLVISITGWMKIIYIPALFPLARYIYIYYLFIYPHTFKSFFFVHERLFCDELKQKLHKLIALC